MDEVLYNQLYGQQDKLLKRAHLDHKQLIRDYEQVFKTPEGQRVLEDIMSICRINSSTFSGNSTTFYLEGVQDVGKAIKRRVMEGNPDVYFRVERRVWEEEQSSREEQQ